MFQHLQIPYRQERWLVGLADAGLGAVTLFGWPPASRTARAATPRRILLLRLERVGDLLMVLDAIAQVRTLAPQAQIDLVVGSWNRALAGLIPSVDTIETLDVPWMAREGRGLSWRALVGCAKAWRSKSYDVAINFEPDIRSNLLLALSGATRRVGFLSGGGGSVLTDAIAPDPRAHIADNAKALVARAFETTGLKPCATDAGATGLKPRATDVEHRTAVPVEQGFSPVASGSVAQGFGPVAPASVAQGFSLVAPASVEQGFSPVASGSVAQGFGPVASGSVAQGFSPVLKIPDEARRRAVELIGSLTGGGVTIGIQPAAGRQVKEWDPVRFAEVGAELARARAAKIVLIGSESDRGPLDAFRAAWPAALPLVQLPPEIDLVVLAAVLERLGLFITGDTGPMHLAAAVGTPVLAVFGPSLPTRYAPLSPKSRIVRIDIHCSPCNRMRRPPERCVGHVPDCLAGIESAVVLKVAYEMLQA